ncbi:GNAT family N-acetyltransferase [Zafaria sp. J156]|uniref:GNAT family N-acetyltransferase n=1 Tax=Zafaria sp. J156 TaxID=3116490 RepID=UPI002E77342D|nr:GNAT family N-acetyltransferase [Zafaria sp. J156]MEE1621342.1 GNAT family N-acetyltransferase [Zafaria sp. J156]
MTRTVTTTHLQMSSADALRPSATPLPPGCRIERAVDATPEFSRFLYQGVGSGWNWADRLAWSRAHWAEVLAAPGTETWVLYRDGSPAGYVELAARTAGSGATPTAAADGAPGTAVEIVYFGLFPGHLGLGLGGALLTEGIRRAWDLDARHPGLPPVGRVWVHTCSLDGPAALANYRARGLEVFHVEDEELEPVDASAGPWPRESGD